MGHPQKTGDRDCAHYMDASMQDGVSMVRTAGDGDWMLSDPSIAVIHLGEDASELRLARAVWTLCHLPFPVVDVFDTFQIHRTGRAGAKEVFLRNASSIVIGEEVKKIVFFVSDKAQRKVVLEGVSHEVARPTRFNDIATLAVPWDATATIHSMVGTCMRAPSSLKFAFSAMLRKRTITYNNNNYFVSLHFLAVSYY